jgi:hypothetical protein
VIIEEPAEIPITVPLASTGAIPDALLYHVPPEMALLSEVLCPWHTCSVPVIAAGNVETVTIVVAWQPVVSV